MSLHRTQVLLEPWQHEQLKALAREEGRSLSDVLREMVSDGLERRPRRRRRILDLAGIAPGAAVPVKDLDAELYGPDW